MEKQKKNVYENMTAENLLKKKKLFTGVFIGFGIIAVFAFAIIIYLLKEKGFKNNNIASFIPLLILPITFVPLLVNFSLLNKEVKARNL